MNLREVREAAELHREGIKADIDVVVDYALATIDPSPDSAIRRNASRDMLAMQATTIENSNRTLPKMGSVLARC